MKTREEWLHEVRSFPSFPPVAARLSVMSRDPDIDLRDLAKVIELDPGLTARLLRMANSAFWGLPGSVTHVRDAVLRLGLERLYQVVMVSSVAPMLSGELSGYGLGRYELWQHSLAVAVVAEGLAVRVMGVSPATAFTTGLLHDIGKVIMNKYLAAHRIELEQELAEREPSFEDAERAVFGVHHADLSAEILEHWRLPAPIVNAVRYCYRPEDAPPDTMLADVLHLANILALISGIGVGSGESRVRASSATIAKIGVTPRMIVELVSRVEAELSAAKELLGIEQE